jgi:hypothetical protein
MRYNAVCLDVFLSLSDGSDLPLLIFHVVLKSVRRKPGAAASRSVGQFVQTVLQRRRNADCHGGRVAYERIPLYTS